MESGALTAYFILGGIITFVVYLYIKNRKNPKNKIGWGKSSKK